nr:TonB-dependent receptor [Burkholderiaceae bacterium]
VSLIHQTGPWYTRADLTRVQAQERVAPNELPTDGYTMLNVYLSHRLKTGGPVVWELFARGTNLLNVEARNHVSVLKDIAPMAGRGLLVGVRGTF